MKIALLAAVALLALSPPAIAKKKSKAPPPPNLSALSAAMDTQSDKIAECALADVTAGSVNVDVNVVINSKGQVVYCKVAIDPSGAATDKTRACVEQALRAVAFPPVHDPLVSIQRRWNFTLAK